MSEASARMHLRQHLEAHLTELGYSRPRMRRAGLPTPEISRVSPVHGRIVYGQTVVRADLQRRHCHEQLLLFSQRRTRRRSSILLFIGVDDSDAEDLEALLERLGIRSRKRCGHVHVVPIPPPAVSRRQTPPRAKSS